MIGIFVPYLKTSVNELLGSIERDDLIVYTLASSNRRSGRVKLTLILIR